MTPKQLAFIGLRPFVMIAVLALLAGGLPAGAQAAAPEQADGATVTLPWPRVTLQQLPGDFAQPLHIAHAGDGSGRLFVVEKAGLIRIYQNGQTLATPFLDIRDRVKSSCNECGLLSVAFSPDYATGGYFFVYYTAKADVASPEPSDNGNSAGNDTVVARFTLSADPNAADAGSETQILVRNQPFTNHNGGQLAFGPDGYLYIGLGDGGSGGDPLDNAQDPGTWLGKLLRIQVGKTGGYTVPPTNPFVNQPGYLPEIWAYGLRNPWRFSFDRTTGDLYIGDVGQDAYEEINHQPAGDAGGHNYGWNPMEGMHCYPSGSSCDPSKYVLPVAEYAHGPNDSIGCSVTGGAVYRGAPSALQDIYFYADYCTGRIWGLRRAGGQWTSSELAHTRLRLSSFGEDEAGNLYVAELSDANFVGHLYRVTGTYLMHLPAVLR